MIHVDLEDAQVYFNDSGVSFGQGMQVPLSAFLSAWAASGYRTTVVANVVGSAAQTQPASA